MSRSSPLLRGLFDAGIATEEVDLYDEPLAELLPEEADAIRTARTERLVEFRAGRHCARVALARLGYGPVSIPRAEDRAPVWPDDITGSITHTRDRKRGWVGAVVAHKDVARSVGVDAEHDEPLKEDLWRRILTRAEHEWVLRHPEAERGLLGKLVFSAKEAVYKCQFQLSHEFLDFLEVELAVPSEHGFTATLLRDASPFRAGYVFEGRYVRRDGYIVTGVTLARARASP